MVGRVITAAAWHVEFLRAIEQLIGEHSHHVPGSPWPSVGAEHSASVVSVRDPQSPFGIRQPLHWHLHGPQVEFAQAHGCWSHSNRVFAVVARGLEHFFLLAH